MHYYLMPYTWIMNPENESYWEVPGAVGVIDLRSRVQMGQVGPTPLGMAFATFVSPIADPNAIPLGDSLSSFQNKSAAESALGLGVGEIVAPILVDAIWEVLVQHADPIGDTRWRPLMPTVNRLMELHLGGHSLLKTEKFDVAQHPLVIPVAQGNYRRLREQSRAGLVRNTRGEVDREFYRQYLQTLVEKYRLPFEAFIPPGLPSETPMPHGTTITDNFNRGDESLDAGSWVEVDGDWSVTTNEVENGVGAGSAFPGLARRSDSLATDDHYSEIEYKTQETEFAYMGGAARASGTSNANENAYVGRVRDRNNDEDLEKTVNGSLTSLATATGGGAPPHTVRVEANGSTIKLIHDASEIHSVTDTAITGNLTPGIAGHQETAHGSFGDDFEAADLAAPAGAPFYYNWRRRAA